MTSFCVLLITARLIAVLKNSPKVHLGDKYVRKRPRPHLIFRSNFTFIATVDLPIRIIAFIDLHRIKYSE